MRSRLEPTPKRESGLVEVYVDITRLIERLHPQLVDEQAHILRTERE